VSIGAAVGVAVSLDHDMVYPRGLGEMQSVSEACFLIDAMLQVKSWEDERWQGCSSVIHSTASGHDHYFLAAHATPRSIEVLYARSAGDTPYSR
jgi:hypothetical protein